MSGKILKYNITLNAKDIWVFSVYSANRAYLGVFNLLFTLVSLYYLFAAWKSLSPGKRLLFLACALMFSVIQPAILYLKALRQAKTETISKGFAITLSEEGIHILQGENEANANWDQVYKTLIRKNVVVIYFAPLSGYLIPSRYIGDSREDLETLLKAKTRVSRF